MTRRLGVVLALCALAGVASADQAKPKKAAPAAKKEKAPEPPPPADGAAADGSAEDGSGALPPGVTAGPSLIDLGNNTEIDLPAGLFFVDKETTKAELEKDGNTGENIAGMVVSPGNWSVYIDYMDDGYVDDSDAKDLDPNALFQSFQQGNTAQNERRRSLGKPELFLDGWSEMPRYDASNHHLVWGLRGHDNTGQVVNFFTRVLGRNGYMSLDLVADAATIDKAKTEATAVLAATRFKPGFKYEDHKSGDKSSGMGLKALVLGGAAVAAFKVAKAGILVKILAGGWKLIVLACAGIAGFFKKIFGRGPKPTNLPPDGPPVG
jgi:uncharacterized membrane-anchored protein